MYIVAELSTYQSHADAFVYVHCIQSYADIGTFQYDMQLCIYGVQTLHNSAYYKL